VNRSELIARYRAGVGAVDAALQTVDLDRAESAEEWTPRQVVHHLADSTTVAAVRLRRLVAEASPEIASYDEAHYARSLHYDRPVDSSVALLRGLVESNAELLESLTDAEWSSTGTHDEYPDGYSIDLWLERQAEHVHEHAEQIARCGR
jgi:hypothetical protein